MAEMIAAQLAMSQLGKAKQQRAQQAAAAQQALAASIGGITGSDAVQQQQVSPLEMLWQQISNSSTGF